MYSFEITEYLNKRNYTLTPKEFVDVINSSPQIKEVYFKGGDEFDRFKMQTDDGFNWNIKINKPKKLTLKKDSN